jgi:ABC-2 type transport system permease protein
MTLKFPTIKIPKIKMPFKESSATIRTLISLQFKANIKPERSKSLTFNIVKYLLLGFLAAAAMGVFCFIYYSVANQFIGGGKTSIDLSKEFLTFTIAGFMFIQTIFLIPLLIKILDINNDRVLLLRMPISSRQIFISKVVVAYCFELLFAAVLLMPLLIVFGVATSMVWWFYLLIPFLILFVPVFPFFIAMLLLFPLIKIGAFLKKRTWFMALIYLGLLVGSIVLYMTLIEGGVKILADDGFVDTLEKNAELLRKVAHWILPAISFAKISGTGLEAFMYFGIIVASSVVMLTIALVTANAQYKKLYMEEHSMISNFKRTSKYQTNGTRAVIKKDIMNVVRSSNYLFQFLIVVIITPLLIFYTNRICGLALYFGFSGSGQTDQSFGKAFETSIFIAMVLLPLACSFAASSITREGSNLFHTKLIPVSFRKQILVKALIVFIPVIVASAIGIGLSALPYSVIATHKLEGIGLTDAFIFMAISIFMAIGYIALGMYLDLLKPMSKQVGGKELIKSIPSVNFIIVFGAILGFGFGAFALFASFANLVPGLKVINKSIVQYSLIGISAFFAIVSGALLFINGPKKYRGIEG